MGSDAKKLANFLYEAGQLKRVARSGWWVAGIKQPESVAEHSWRTAVLGYLLAKRANEGATRGAGGKRTAAGTQGVVDAKKVAVMCLLHDLPEARVNDTHKIAQRYLNSGESELQAAAEQAKVLPADLGKEYLGFIKEQKADKTKEAKLAHDADLLECAMQGREYENDGFQATGDWVKRVGMQLATKEAKELFREIAATKPDKWWKGLKKAPLKRGRAAKLRASAMRSMAHRSARTESGKKAPLKR